GRAAAGGARGTPAVHRGRPAAGARRVTEPPMVGIGLMSGTSLDGVDAALVRIEGPTHATLLDFVTRPYDDAERAELLTALAPGAQADAASFARLHVRIAEWAADAIQTLLA